MTLSSCRLLINSITLCSTLLFSFPFQTLFITVILHKFHLRLKFNFVEWTNIIIFEWKCSFKAFRLFGSTNSTSILAAACICRSCMTWNDEDDIDWCIRFEYNAFDKTLIGTECLKLFVRKIRPDIKSLLQTPQTNFTVFHCFTANSTNRIEYPEKKKHTI